MRYLGILAVVGLILAVTATAGATYYVEYDFETSWAGDYAPGWENMEYRWGPAPVGKMMEQVAGGYGGSMGMKLIADSVPVASMWWAGVSPVGVSGSAMAKQYDPWFSAMYYDAGVTAGNDPAGQLFAVPSWVNMYIAPGEDWTDIQLGARDNVEDKYYFVACGQANPGWVSTGVARSDGWHELKMQLSSADGKIHFSIDGTEVGTSWRGDYVDLGSELGLYTRFAAPLSAWGNDKPYTIWDNVKFGSSIPEPLTMAGLALGIGSLATYLRRRRAA